MKRLVTGLAISLVWVAILLSQSFALLWVAAVLIAGLALYEYLAMCLDHKEKAAQPLAIAIGLLPVLGALGRDPQWLLVGFFAGLLLSALLLFTLYARLDNGFLLFAKLGTGLALISLGCGHLPLLMALPQGTAWLAVLTIITIASDTGAYYSGTLFGKTKLCPSISPGKTVEGLIGGLLASLGLALLAARLLLPTVAIGRLAAAILLVTLLGVSGDLTESIIKRSCRVKDSGALLPGHGGVLDRIDSLLTAAPAMYYLVHLGFI